MSRTSTGSSSRRDPGASVTSSVPKRPSELEAILRSLDVVPSKRFGQSFLLDPFIADGEVALLDVTPGEPVLEIGGGLGRLTEALLRRGLGPLTVIERDPRLASFLRSTFGTRIALVEGDALDVPWPPTRAVIGNLPFSVATPILERLWREGVPRFVGMLQQEVAERLASPPGSKVYGRLSIIAALFGSVELYQVVPPAGFYPVPAVAGRLIRFLRREGPLPVPSVERFEAMLQLIFSARRKQLGNLLPRVTGGTRTPDSVARAAEWPSEWAHLRPEQLEPDAYFRLARDLHSGRPTRTGRMPRKPQA